MLPPKTHVRCFSKLTGHLLAAKHTCLLSHNHLDVDQTLHTDKNRELKEAGNLVWELDGATVSV